MGTLIIGSASNKAGVTIEPKKVLFNDNNVKYIKSGLTEIWSHITSLVPIMTSNTTPYGEAKAYCGNTSAGIKTNYYLFFDGIINAGGLDQHSGNMGNITSMWVQYKFIKPTNVVRVAIAENTDDRFKLYTAKLQYSNDGSTWNDAGVINATNNPSNFDYYYYDVPNDNYALYWRIQGVTSKSSYKWSLCEIQFYGTQLEALIPKMTSNTTPSGEASATNVREPYLAWKSFDNDASTHFEATGSTSLLQYKFTKSVCAKHTIFSVAGIRVINVKIVASNDGKEWTTLKTVDNCSGSNNVVTFENKNKYLYYGLDMTQVSTGVGIIELQFFG